MPFSLKSPVADAALVDRLQEGLDVVERSLEGALASSDGFVAKALGHLFAAGGKRVRPLLTLIASEFGDGQNRDVRIAAAVVELTHLATLYHDDVMDSAPTRRGAPSAHALWGNSVAILAGDLLFARASRLVSQLGPEAVVVQAETFERLCMGQLHETVGPHDDEDPVEHYLQVIADKTGSLIATSGWFGARYAGVSDDTTETITRFCEKIGIAFQLADDVLDVSSDSEESGKTPGTDLREGVPTLPVLLSRRAAADGDEDAQRVVELIDGDLSSDEALAEAVSALRESEAMRQAQAEADRGAEDAKAELLSLPQGSARDLLLDLADQLVHRDR